MKPARTASLLLAAAKAPLMIGGQAVMEGVMMKSASHLATAVRLENGKIKLHEVSGDGFARRHGLHRIPFVRGVFVLLETLVIGLRELNWSANQAIGEDEELGAWELGITLVLSIGLAIALFKLLPLFLASTITGALGGGNWALNVLDGLLKFAIFAGYLLAISLMPDVRRLFRYHGAEHKAVNCYEAGKKLTPKNAQGFTSKQPRCGTTFVAYVLLLSILLYLLIPFSYGFWVKLGLRLLLLPVLAGIVYEWIRVAGTWYYTKAWVRAVSAPGMAVQRLTLREPDHKHLAVAIAALKNVLKKEGVRNAAQ